MPHKPYNAVGGATQTVSAITANGASLSSEVRYDGFKYLAIMTPGTMSAGTFTFQVSGDGLNFKNLYDASGTEVKAIVAVDRAVSLDTLFDELSPYSFLKIRSGVAATPVNEAAARTWVVVMKS